MNGKALVTGGETRLGREIALCLASRGLDVALHCHASAAETEEVAKACRSMGVKSEILAADLTNEDQVLALVPAAAQALGGPLTVLVNSASVFEKDTIQTGTRDSWDQQMTANLRVPFVLSQAFAQQAPDPAIQGEWNDTTAAALIINLVDQRDLKQTPQFVSYALAEAGLWRLTQTAAMDLAPGIRVNAIGPAPRQHSYEHFGHQGQSDVQKKRVEASEITRAVGYLLDVPSVTGQLICVAGGPNLAQETQGVMGRA